MTHPTQQNIAPATDEQIERWKPYLHLGGHIPELLARIDAEVQEKKRLWDAAFDVLKETEFLIAVSGGMPTVKITNERGPAHRKLRDVMAALPMNGCAPPAQPAEHVCGLQGFGKPEDVCPACQTEPAEQAVSPIAYIDEDGAFHCPCGAIHRRGPIDGHNAYRCLRCGDTQVAILKIATSPERDAVKRLLADLLDYFNSSPADYFARNPRKDFPKEISEVLAALLKQDGGGK